MEYSLIIRILAGLIFQGIVFSSSAKECETLSVKPVNITVFATVVLPQNAASAAPGTVLYAKESSLSDLSGIHRPVTKRCVEQVNNILQGHIIGSQSGKNIIATSLPGLGLRVTIILNKTGLSHKEWTLPFNASFENALSKALTTDDFRIRIELIKTSEIRGGTLTLRFPALLTLDGNALVVNLSLTIAVAKSYCTIELAQPQVALPPVTVSQLLQDKPTSNVPLGVSLHCLNTRRTSLSLEGTTLSENSRIFRNMAKENPAEGVGVSVTYNGRIMLPNTPLDITLPYSQKTYVLPLSARYTRSGKKITGGKLKTQITLHINYL